MSTSPTTTPSNTSSRRRKPLLVGVAVAVAVLGLVLGGRALVRNHYLESRSYPSVAAVPPHNGVFVVPAWAPADSTDITINAQTQGKGRSITLTSRTALTGCRPTPSPRADPVPDLHLSHRLRTAAGDRCEQWFVIRDNTTVYGWEAYS